MCSSDLTAQEQAADKIAAISGMDKVFFCNSGCEANEAAIKLARLYGHDKGIELPSIIVMDQAFHGRTLATMSASGKPADRTHKRLHRPDGSRIRTSASAHGFRTQPRQS